jgi:hypothetical protein
MHGIAYGSIAQLSPRAWLLVQAAVGLRVKSDVIDHMTYNELLLAPVLALSTLCLPATAQRVANTSVQYGKSFRSTGLDPRPTAGPHLISAVDRGVAFYTEDFSGGAIPLGWTNVDDLTPAADDPVFFQWSNNPNAVDPASGGFDEIDSFDGAGASNGYLWANSDRGLAVAPATEHLTRLTTSAIDCSGQSTVLFSMHSTIGVFNNDANEFVKLRVSTNLFDWEEFFPFPCLEAGSPAPPCSRFSANPQTVEVNITSVAANQTTVYLQFEWQGDWEYYWAIDDLSLSPLPDNEIVMNYGYQSTTGLGEEYGRIPQSQLPVTINLGAELLDFGALDQTNVVVDISYADTDGNEVFAVSTDVGTLSSQETVITDEDVILPALPTGNFTGTYSVTSDQILMDGNISDNTRLRSFEVTNDIYALDNVGNHPAGITEVLTPTGTGSFEGNTEDVKLMTMYYINAPYTVTGLEIGLDGNSDPGGAIVISILDTTDVLANPSVVNLPLAESDFHILTQAEITARKVTIEFPFPVTLDVGAYYAVASLYADGNADVYVVDDETVPQPALASVLWLPFDPDNQFLYGGNGTAWAIRMTSDPNISVHEYNELEGLTMFPNPTNGILRINSVKSEKYTVEVQNMLGAKVMTNVFTGNIVLDLAGFADGVYSVRVSNGTLSFVQRITLN